MNEVYKIIDFLINQFKTNELVNTITFVPTIEIDSQKANIYPLVNIDFLEKETNGDVIECTFKLTAVTEKLTQAKQLDSKLRLDTNYIDNLNEMGNITTKFINNCLNVNNAENIELVSKTNEKPFKYGLDGFQFEVVLSIPNKTLLRND